MNFFSKRSSQLGTNTTILSVAVIAILAILNFLSFRHSKRFDLTSEKYLAFPIRLARSLAACKRT